MEKEKDWTVIRLLQWTTGYLESRGFHSPRSTAELLLGHVLSFNRLDLYLKFDKPVLQPDLSRFREIIKRRLKNEPVQYIIGETDFHSVKIIVGPAVLIPRPETEILVDKAVHYCGERWQEESPVTILDIGTGSGNISAGIAKNVPSVRMEAMDISLEALNIAKRNAVLNGLDGRIRFHRLSIFEAGPSLFHDLHGMVSNPPYVSQEEFKNLPEEIRNYEPECALNDGGDGFLFYPVICRRSMDWLRSGGFLLVETGMGGAAKVAAIFRESGLEDVDIIMDLSGIERIVCGWKP